MHLEAVFSRWAIILLETVIKEGHSWRKQRLVFSKTAELPGFNLKHPFLLLIIFLFAPFVHGQEFLPANFYYSKPHYGLDILVIKDKTVPLVTIELAVKNGAFTETAEYDGLSHLYEHMFFKANKTYPTHAAYQERVKELGIIYNGTTSAERVNYFITLSNRKLKEGLEFMSAAIQHPLFLEETR